MPPVILHYSESLVRRAVLSFWWRSTGPHFFISILGMLAVFCYLLWSGDRSWLVGMLGACIAILALVATAAYTIHFRGSMARFRRMKSPTATLELGEDRFRMSSDVGASEMDWSSIMEIWQFPDYWLVLFSRSQFVTLPTSDLDEATREFVLAKSTAAGAKVT